MKGIADNGELPPIPALARLKRLIAQAKDNLENAGEEANDAIEKV